MPYALGTPMTDDPAGNPTGDGRGKSPASKATQFGGPRAPAAGRSGPGEAPGQGPVEVAGDGVLAAMRHVLLNAKKWDKTPLQALYRDMRKANAGKFAELYQRLEAEASQPAGAETGPGASDPAPPAADEVADRLLALCREKLRRIADKVKGGG
jgi:hypothetical protein